MRVITLNIWGGRKLRELEAFFLEHGPSTDVFCLQEVLDTDLAFEATGEPPKQGCIFRSIQRLLPEFDGDLARFEETPDKIALAVFVRRSLRAEFVPSAIVHKTKKLQMVRVPCGNGHVLVANLHGLWDATGRYGKGDFPERLDVSRAVRAATDVHQDPLLLCGDFNLLPGTQALEILASGGLRNLVLECGVTNTRTHLYRSFDTGAPLFADYVLMSPALKLVQFDVLPDVVSDHAALRVDFEWGHS